MCVIKTKNQDSEHTAVTGHAALPHAQDRQWFAQHLRFVEKDVTEPSAEQHSEDGVAENEVGYLVRGKIGITAFSEMAVHPIGTAKREDISQTVPPRPDIVPETKDERIKV